MDLQVAASVDEHASAPFGVRYRKSSSIGAMGIVEHVSTSGPRGLQKWTVDLQKEVLCPMGGERSSTHSMQQYDARKPRTQKWTFGSQPR